MVSSATLTFDELQTNSFDVGAVAQMVVFEAHIHAVISR